MNNNNRDARLSVIIPAYNCEKTVEYCVNSIQKQSYDNLEIIIVDDGSKDSTFEVLNRIAKSDNRVFVYRKENGGQASARNYGLTKCTGQYITFVDDDDYIDENMYELLIRKMEEFNVPVAGCGTCAEDEDGNILYTTQFGKSGLKNSNDVIFNILYGTKACWGTVWNKVFSSSLKEYLLFPTGCELEDYWVILRMLLNIKSLYYSDDKMYHWIQRQSSQSHRIYHNNMLTTIKVIDGVIRYYKENDVEKDLINACYYYKETLLASLVIRMWKTNDNETIRLLKKEIIPLFGKYLRYGIKITKMRKQHTKDFIHACIIYERMKMKEF